MKRGDFLKKIGLGIGGAIVAPKVLVEMLAKEKTQKHSLYRRKDPHGGFEMSNARFVGHVYWDGDGKRHIVLI